MKVPENSQLINVSQMSEAGDAGEADKLQATKASKWTNVNKTFARIEQAGVFDFSL